MCYEEDACVFMRGINSAINSALGLTRMRVCAHVMRRRMHASYEEQDICDSSDALSLTCMCACML